MHSKIKDYNVQKPSLFHIFHFVSRWSNTDLTIQEWWWKTFTINHVKVSNEITPHFFKDWFIWMKYYESLLNIFKTISIKAQFHWRAKWRWSELFFFLIWFGIMPTMTASHGGFCLEKQKTLNNVKTQLWFSFFTLWSLIFCGDDLHHS